MPINYLRYHPDWKDIIRPDALKRAKYQCQHCKVPNRALIVYEQDGRWLEADEIIQREERKHGRKVRRVILTIAHMNHLVIDNRPENLKALCQKCHLKHDREHSTHMRRLGKITVFAHLWEEINKPDAQYSLPHVFAVYRAKRNTAAHLKAILDRRTAKGYTSKYDTDIDQLYKSYFTQANKLLHWAAGVLADAYHHPDPLAFYSKYYDSELRLIGTTTKDQIYADHETEI